MIEVRGGDPRFHELLKGIADLHNAKNTDYASGGAQGSLGNFIRASEIKQLYVGFDWTTPFGTAIDFMLKQLDAALILYAAGKDSVTGEPPDIRLRDVAVYALLAMLLYRDEVQQKNKLD